MEYLDVKTARAEVCETAKQMHARGLAPGTWGNISARADDGRMVITPSGMDYTKLNPEDMVAVNIETLEYEGALKPSIESRIHAAVYMDRPEAGGIVHTHSIHALMLAAARKPIPPICDDQVQILGGDVRLAGYTMPGSKEMAEEVTEALKNRFGALIANHGAIAIGSNLSKALLAAQVLENTAQVYVGVQALGGAAIIPEEDIRYFHDFFQNKYGQR